MLESAVNAERGVSARPRTRPAAELIETAIPARLDRLIFGRFHALVVVALGITWIFDGLEVTLAGAVAGRSRRAQASTCPMPMSVSPIWPAR
jgi:hypothetical protein